jgi:hypothetical protein
MWLRQVFAELGILLDDMAVGIDDLHFTRILSGYFEYFPVRPWSGFAI